MSVQFASFPDRDRMTDQLLSDLMYRLDRAIADRGVASLVVSGGETPRQLFHKLSQQPLAWENVFITLADERWTDVNSEQSNEHLARSILLKDEAARANFVGLKTEHTEAAAALSVCEKRLGNIPAPFDVVLLGMGNDGHTASLFPGADTLPQALDLKSGRRLAAITPDPLPEQAPFPRISMTLPQLLQSRWLVLLLAGYEKYGVYNAALAGDDTDQMPVRGVLKQSSVPMAVYWSP